MIALLIPPISPYGAILAILLLIAFTGIVSVSLLRGRRVPCGCFTPRMNKPISLWVVIRNELLIIASAIYVNENLSLEAPPILWGIIALCSVLDFGK